MAPPDEQGEASPAEYGFYTNEQIARMNRGQLYDAFVVGRIRVMALTDQQWLCIEVEMNRRLHEAASDCVREENAMN